MREMPWLEEAKELRDQGMTYKAIGEIVGRDGTSINRQLNPISKENTRKYKMEWRINNPEKAKARNAEYCSKNREKACARATAWRIANPERAKIGIAKWQKENPEKVAVIGSRRRATEKNVAINDLTDDQWIEILESYDGHCCYCGCTDKPLTQDHIIPLTRRGNNTSSNVAPACKPCNSSKHNKLIDEWIKRGGYPLHPPYKPTEVPTCPAAE